jgi:hypothetical protein
MNQEQLKAKHKQIVDKMQKLEQQIISAIQTRQPNIPI